MNIFNKFKVNYNLKLLDDFVLNNNKEDIFSLLKETKNKNKELFFQLLNHFTNNYKNHSIRENFFSNKVVLINSFEIDDCNYLSNFFSFYFNNMNLKTDHDSLANAIAKDLENLNLSHFPKKIDFQCFIEFSDLFFNSLLVNMEDKNVFLKSNSAFFEVNEKNFFIYPNTTAAYFLIHKNPFHIYSSLKRKFSSSQEALNKLFNFQNMLVSNQDFDCDYDVSENRQSWNIYSNSWRDPNVISTFRGLLIPSQDFTEKPHETLTKTIFHLIQAGVKVEMNYDLIDQYVLDNKLEDEHFIDDISNKEKKIILSNFDQNLLEYFNYKI